MTATRMAGRAPTGHVDEAYPGEGRGQGADLDDFTAMYRGRGRGRRDEEDFQPQMTQMNANRSGASQALNDAFDVQAWRAEVHQHAGDDIFVPDGDTASPHPRSERIANNQRHA